MHNYACFVMHCTIVLISDVLIFAVNSRLSVKTSKTRPHDNFPLYSINLYMWTVIYTYSPWYLKNFMSMHWSRPRYATCMSWVFIINLKVHNRWLLTTVWTIPGFWMRSALTAWKTSTMLSVLQHSMQFSKAQNTPHLLMVSLKNRV